MKVKGLVLGFLGASIFSVGCSQKPATKAATGSPGAANSTGTTEVGSEGGCQTGTAGCASDPSTWTGTSYPSGYFTGLDPSGKTKFGLLLNAYGASTNPYTIGDTSIASMTMTQVTPSSDTISKLQTTLAGSSCGVPAANITQIMSRFGKSRSVVRVTPLKAGVTTITAVTPHYGGHGGGGGGGGGFNPNAAEGQTLNTFQVVDYTDAQLQEGQTRYTAGLASDTTDDPACTSCHNTGKDGAPSHALGTVSQIPDVAAEQWVTTGQVGSLKAPINHAWKFASSDEELGTVAYVRSLETSDAEALILLDFAETISHFGIDATVNSDGTFLCTTPYVAPTTQPGQGG